MSVLAQRTVGESTNATPAARPYTPTRLTSWCPGSSVPPCPSREVSTQSHSPAAGPALLTTCARNLTPCPQTPCTTTPTSTPPPMNTTWEQRPGRHPILYLGSEDTRTTTTWTRPQLTCIQPPVAPLTMTTGPGNDCFPPGPPHKHAGRRSWRSCSVRSQAETSLMDKSSRIYLKEMPLSWTASTCSESRGCDWRQHRNASLPGRCRRTEEGADSIWSQTGVESFCYFCVGCTFWFFPVFIAFKKAIRYIVHQPL